MPVRHCAIIGLANGDYKLQKWRKTFCKIHGFKYDSGGCTCEPPFKLFHFPNNNDRNMWKKLVCNKRIHTILVF